MERSERGLKKPRPNALSDRQIAGIIARAVEGKRIRRTLQPWGRLHIDRRLPFLSVYRQPPDCPDPGTSRLIVGSAAYLNASGEASFRRQLSRLLEKLALVMSERFGACLLMEVWSADMAPRPEGTPLRPAFAVHHHPAIRIRSTVDTLQEQLARVKALKQRAEVAVYATARIAPPGMKPLLPAKRLRALGAYHIGLEISSIYVDPLSGDLYPVLLRLIRRQLSRVLHKTFFEFSHQCTNYEPPHFHALGRRAMVKAVWEVDRHLAAVSDSFDFLLQVTPVNAERAWRTFQRAKFERPPVFLYRPRSLDPLLAKRRLFDIRIERLEDPTLQHLFLEKQIELDRQLTMLQDLGTKEFLYESLQLHGHVDRRLLDTAKDILDYSPSQKRLRSRLTLSSAEFAQRADAEIRWYKMRYPEFKGVALVSDEMYSGLMVSRNRLLIGKDLRVPQHRAEALLQHEVGTHLLTYFNGGEQPFKMLQSGLPGYDALQEGLAVLAEYLVGGLTADRLRVLAARVIAARALVDGASFVDVFRQLTRTYGFSQRAAYTITMRAFRGGGLLKDAVYLRGLMDILKYIARGGDFDILFTGKIATGYVSVVQELVMREILKPPCVFPKYFEIDEARARLDRLRRQTPVLGLLSN